jgi:hypothetical protein
VYELSFFPCPTQTTVFYEGEADSSHVDRRTRDQTNECAIPFEVSGWLVSPGACGCEDRRLRGPRESFRGARPDSQVENNRVSETIEPDEEDGATCLHGGKRFLPPENGVWNDMKRNGCFERIC